MQCAPIFLFSHDLAPAWHRAVGEEEEEEAPKKAKGVLKKPARAQAFVSTYLWLRGPLRKSSTQVPFISHQAIAIHADSSTMRLPQLITAHRVALLV